MRTTILALLMAGLLVAVPAALADGDGGKGRRADADRHDNDDDNDDRGNKTAERANRTAARENWTANRTALFDSVSAQLMTLRASWHENATKVRESCHALDHENATKAERHEQRHCIRDGYASWRAAHRADIKELREQMRELLDSLGKKGRGHDS